MTSVMGNCRLEFLQTPGHTTGNICIVMTGKGEPGLPGALVTGDTLFIGDVGRPDLSANDTQVYPAHGAGSLCGRQMSSATRPRSEESGARTTHSRPEVATSSSIF